MRYYYIKERGYMLAVSKPYKIPYDVRLINLNDYVILKFIRSAFRHNRQSFIFKITKL